MQSDKHAQKDQCFLDHQNQQLEHFLQEDIIVNISPQFYKQLPANQLRAARRPENLAPRTFFLERPFYHLQHQINLPCIEKVTSVQLGKLKLKIANNHNLNIQQYFGKKKFKCIYNRLQTYNKENQSFQGRLKSVDSLVDYNWKFFKQLEPQPKTVKENFQDRIDADFESGNLCRAYVTAEQERQFYLLIQNDLNTYGYNNWFFFRLKNTKIGVRRFTIVNLIKKTKFFSQGMLISIFSACKNKNKGEGWFKGGDNITFGNINLTRNHHSKDNYCSLSFQHNFQYENDQVYFALNQPYTYSRLITFLDDLKQKPKITSMEIKTVGYSISNNIIPAVRFNTDEEKDKQIILVLGRQHPCETVGSFIAQKMMQSLQVKNEVNKYLFQNFDILIIPMVNPDGVIHGSSRCNMAGFDLNRQWGQYIIKELTPQTVKIKQFIINLTKNQKIKYMLDLHGHGKKLDSFFFSCKERDKQDVRLLSTVMQKLQPRFNINSCTYGITSDKQNTIRSTINSMGIAHSYTLETSLFGWKDEKNQIRHFNEQDYNQIAKNLINSLFVLQADPQLCLKYLGVNKENIINEINRSLEKNNREDDNNFDDNDILSDSDPEGDKLDMKELLGKCKDKNLKKKIQDQFNQIKRHQKKRERNLTLESKNCKSTRNMRQTCLSSLNIRGKLSTTHHSYIRNDLFKKEDFRPNSTKKISLSQKWKEKRKQIERKKMQQQKQLYENALDRMYVSKINEKARTKTQANIKKPMKQAMPYSNFVEKKNLSKTRHLSNKIKTQFRQFDEVNFPSEQQITQNETRKSVLQNKFKELKQQSLNVLLTDTLSIMKLAPNQKQRQSYFSPQLQRQTKTLISKQRSKHEHLATEPNLMHSIKMMPLQDKNSTVIDKESIRYRKFKQYLQGNNSKKRDDGANSVFYYFPIL